MPDSTATAQQLSLPEELVLMLLNEQNGYFHQVPGWDLNCAVTGAVLAELSLLGRIDTDLDSLILVDAAETGDPVLDPVLAQIADEPAQRDAVYWIERLAGRAEGIIDQTLDRLVGLGILEHHDGDFWTLATARWYEELSGTSQEGTVGQLVKTRVVKALFTDEIPDPRDIIVICLVNACDVFRVMFELDEETEERIDSICRMDLIGRSIAAAVEHNIASPMLRRSTLLKTIPVVALRRALLSRHVRSGNVPALFADLTEEYGPVFQIRPPFARPMTFLSGPEANRWVHRHGRLHLKAGNYFAEFEKVYGAHGVLPSLDGADHFRLRKAMGPAYSRARLSGHLEEVYRRARQYMAGWTVGETFPVRSYRKLINAQLSPISLSVESQDIIDDLMDFKERALTTHIVNALPRFMLNTPGMKRRAKAVDTLLERIQSVHTPAQRAGCPRDLADDWLSLHASDPQLVPEANLRFALSAALVASVYLGDALSFAVYAMASRPEAAPENPGRSRRAVRRRRSGRGRLRPVLDGGHAPLPDGVPPDVPDRPDVDAGRDEQLRSRGLRDPGRIAGLYRPDRLALHGRPLPGPVLVRYRPVFAAARRAPQRRLRALRARHPPVSRLTLDGFAARRQRADDRALLHPRGDARALR